jgi:hypothetical protein
MVDESLPGGGSAASVCPWCSASYEGVRETCPSCGATLTGEGAADQSLPGLTAIDAAAIVRAKQPVSRPRSRLLSWISGEYPDETPGPNEAGALAPPDLEVRREMLRLELEAEVANLQAEADAMLAEARLDGRLGPDLGAATGDTDMAGAAAAAVVDAAAADAAVLDTAVLDAAVVDAGSQAAVESPDEGAAPA